MADRRQIARLAGILLVLAVIVLVNYAVTRRGPEIATGPGPHRDGGVAFPKAPDRPTISIQRPDGARLAGFVVDSAGLPVAGAEVTAGIEAGTATKPAPDAGVAEVPLAVAVSPPTPADGHFEILGLPAGRYKLEVKGPGLLPAELRYVQVPSDAVRIVVARQVAIDGVVLDGTQPAGNVHVGVRGEPVGGTVEVTTDAKGEFHVRDLPEGHYQVFAWTSALAARAMRVSRVGTGPFAPVELHLETAANVVGRVIDREEGTGIVAEIELRPSGDDQAPRYARSGDDGVFRVEGVPNGRWIAEAFAPGYLAAAAIELDAGHGVPELQLVRGGTIEGRVVDGDGHPIDGATVRALGKDQTEVSQAVERDHLRRFAGRTAAPVPIGATGSDPELLPRGELGVMLGPIPPIPPPGGQVALPVTTEGSVMGDPPALPSDAVWTTGPDGRYRITGVPKGPFTVAAQAPDLAEGRSKPVTLTAGEHLHDVDIVLTAGTYLVGHVTDQHHAVVVGAQVSATPEVGLPVDGFTDADGEYKLGPLAGSVKLHVSAYGHVDVERVVDIPASRSRTASEHREDVVLEVADATVAGDIDDLAGAPVGGAHLTVTGGAGDGRHAVTLADGTFSIDMLPAGPLRVHVDHPDYPADDFSAIATSSGGERAHIRLPIGGAIEGALLDQSSGSPLASVTITAAGPRGASVETATDKAGQWKLGPLRAGRWKIAVKLPGYMATSRELDVPAAHAPGQTSVRDVRIDLVRGANVGGTVRDAMGKRVPGAHVVARTLDGALDCEGDTDTDGEFRLRDCPTGELDLGAAKDDARGTIRATVRPADDIVSLQIDIR